eukprot:9392555-Pyramimonas_sp.AAC.1
MSRRRRPFSQNPSARCRMRSLFPYLQPILNTRFYQDPENTRSTPEALPEIRHSALCMLRRGKMLRSVLRGLYDSLREPPLPCPTSLRGSPPPFPR